MITIDIDKYKIYVDVCVCTCIYPLHRMEYNIIFTVATCRFFFLSTIILSCYKQFKKGECINTRTPYMEL